MHVAQGSSSSSSKELWGSGGHLLRRSSALAAVRLKAYMPHLNSLAKPKKMVRLRSLPSRTVAGCMAAP